MIHNIEEIETKRLLLRRPSVDDAGAVLSSYAGDPDVTKYMLFNPHKSIKDSLDFIHLSDESWERGCPNYNYLIFSKEDMKLIGGVGLLGGVGLGSENHYAPGVATVGYCLAKEEWGKGYATEVCQKMVDLAKECGVKKLVAPVHPNNLASIRVLEKNGFLEDSEASETLFLPNLNKGKGEHVKLVGLSRSLSFSAPPPTLTWED